MDDQQLTRNETFNQFLCGPFSKYFLLNFHMLDFQYVRVVENYN